MATRFYLPSTGAAAVSPAFGAWDDTSEADRRAMVRTRINSAMTGSDITDQQIQNHKYLWRQYVSEPIPAQTISGTVKGQLRVAETSTDDNHDRVTILLKVVSNDGATLRGTLLSLGWYGNTNEYPILASPTNRMLADGDSVSSVAAQANDRIVLEIGTQPSTAPITFEAAIRAVFGDDHAQDLPENETDSSPKNPWIEFSQYLFGQTSTPPSVEIVASVPAQTSAVVAVPPSVGMLLAPSGGSSNVLSRPASVPVVATVPAQVAGLVTDSYDPTTVTPLPTVVAGPMSMVLRPTTPASLGDLTRATQEDSGHVMGPGSGAINLFATVIADSVGQLNPISFVRLFALVSTRDDVPGGKTYVPCTGEGFVVKVSGGARTQYGMVTGTVPQEMGVFDQPVWISDNLTERPAGGPWTWTDINNLVELGITAQYTLGADDFTNLRLDEVWLEVHGALGSAMPAIAVRAMMSNAQKALKIKEL